MILMLIKALFVILFVFI